jgi:hypothetical protein
MHQRAQHCHDVNDGGVHDPAAAGGARIDQRAGDAESHAQRPGRVPEYRGRNDGRLPFVCRQRQQAGQRDVVHVVSGGLGERAVLAPARHRP